MPRTDRQIVYVCQITLSSGRTFTKTFMTATGASPAEVLNAVFLIHQDAVVVRIKEILERRPEKDR